MAGGWRSEERAGGGSKDWCQHGVSECHDLLFRVTMSSEISQDSTPRLDSSKLAPELETLEP